MNDVAVGPAIAAARSGWEARLALAYSRRGPRTILARRAHEGPLVVQKSLYPEGDAVCQSIVVHPPGGIVSGDRLLLDVEVGENARAQLTTPGAAKWYRSTGVAAHQLLHLSAAQGSILEWLHQEAILFDGAIAEFRTEIALSGDAVFLGWDIVCLGRRLAGERWTLGCLRHDFVVHRAGSRQWLERAQVEAASEHLDSAVVLDEKTVFGTFLASSIYIPEELIVACREIGCDEGDVAVTRLPGVLLARYRGDSPEAARSYFTALWTCARPSLASREAVRPRIWNT